MAVMDGTPSPQQPITSATNNVLNSSGTPAGASMASVLAAPPQLQQGEVAVAGEKGVSMTAPSTTGAASGHPGAPVVDYMQQQAPQQGVMMHGGSQVGSNGETPPPMMPHHGHGGVGNAAMGGGGMGSDSGASEPSPSVVGREFVRQYYTVLNGAPQFLYRFYSHDSIFVRGTEENAVEVVGQHAIQGKIESMKFANCFAKIRSVRAHRTLREGVVVQVCGELSNDHEAYRRFVQTFVLSPQAPKKYYLHNDIFEYQDEVFSEDSRSEDDVGEMNEGRLNGTDGHGDHAGRHHPPSRRGLNQNAVDSSCSPPPPSMYPTPPGGENGSTLLGTKPPLSLSSNSSSMVSSMPGGNVIQIGGSSGGCSGVPRANDLIPSSPPPISGVPAVVSLGQVSMAGSQPLHGATTTMPPIQYGSGVVSGPPPGQHIVSQGSHHPAMMPPSSHPLPPNSMDSNAAQFTLNTGAAVFSPGTHHHSAQPNPGNAMDVSCDLHMASHPPPGVHQRADELVNSSGMVYGDGSVGVDLTAHMNSLSMMRSGSPPVADPAPMRLEGGDSSSMLASGVGGPAGEEVAAWESPRQLSGGYQRTSSGSARASESGETEEQGGTGHNMDDSGVDQIQYGDEPDVESGGGSSMKRSWADKVIGNRGSSAPLEQAGYDRPGFQQGAFGGQHSPSTSYQSSGHQYQHQQSGGPLSPQQQSGYRNFGRGHRFQAPLGRGGGGGPPPSQMGGRGGQYQSGYGGGGERGGRGHMYMGSQGGASQTRPPYFSDGPNSARSTSVPPDDCQVFLSGLPVDVKDEELKVLFKDNESFVDVRVRRNQYPVAFVYFNNREAAQECITRYGNNGDQKGGITIRGGTCTIFVERKKARDELSQGRGGMPRGGKGSSPGPGNVMPRGRGGGGRGMTRGGGGPMMRGGYPRSGPPMMRGGGVEMRYAPVQHQPPPHQQHHPQPQQHHPPPSQ